VPLGTGGVVTRFVMLFCTPGRHSAGCCDAVAVTGPPGVGLPATPVAVGALGSGVVVGPIVGVAVVLMGVGTGVIVGVGRLDVATAFPPGIGVLIGTAVLTG